MIIITMDIEKQKKICGGRSQYIWHLGDSFPDIEPENVENIYADGDELEYMTKYFPVDLRGAKAYQNSTDEAKYIIEGLKAFTK